MTSDWRDLDPFDLPDWLGVEHVVWEPDGGIDAGHLVRGTLSAAPDLTLACDLLGIDEAYPVPVADDHTRTRAHQAWQYGQVLLLERAGRPTLAVPGRDFTTERVLEVLARLARAVGASPDEYAALLRLGAQRAGGAGAGR